ncbi:MAG: response regulator [Planctomycetes bacterium]|nr:response regulator [Planctomycetota bacterium]
MKILQVEDSLNETSLLAEAIKSSAVDITVQVAPNGLRAIEHLHLASQGTHDVPDLILLDLKMPVMDGMSFLQVRSKQDALLRIPVVVFISSMKSPTVDKVKTLGATPMVKPMTFDDYLALARRLSRFPSLDATPKHGHQVISVG